jgi:hypothetical protein
MPPRFRSSVYKFVNKDVVPAHIEPAFDDRASSRDASKFSIREEATDPDYGEPQIIAWDIENADDALLLAEARHRHISSLGASGVLKLSVINPSGERLPWPPSGREA